MEFSQLGAALRTAAAEETEDPFIVSALRLLTVSGFRVGEVLSLEWRDVDFERDRITLRDAKSGHRLAIMNPAMREILVPLRVGHDSALKGPRRIEESAPRESSPYVIPDRKPAKPMVGIYKPWARICRSAELSDLRIHDLRHSFASLAAAGGLSLPTIGALLGHKSAQTTHRYIDWVEAGLRQASGGVGTKIAAVMDEKPPEATDLSAVALTPRTY